MKVVVCVKQVPDTAERELKSDGTLDRETPDGGSKVAEFLTARKFT